MKEKLIQHGLTEEEANIVLDKYDHDIIELALKRTVFATKRCFKMNMEMVLKYGTK